MPPSQTGVYLDKALAYDEYELFVWSFEEGFPGREFDGYAAADTRANASRVYNVFRLEDICHQCIHTEIQKSTCIIFCISYYMYHM